MKTEQELRKAMLAKLALSNLDEQDASKLKMKAMHPGADLKLPAAAAGFLIPYFSPLGKITKFYRFRYLEETRKGFALQTEQKSLRYGQPANTVNEIYLPPYLNWSDYLLGDGPLVITEGELKAACATKAGIPTLGLGGVWCFMSKRKEMMLLPLLETAHMAGRMVIICYDSDAATNPDIVMAENVLARRLTERGAVVSIARIPSNGALKVGLDDYLVKYALATFKNKVLKTAFAYEPCAVLHELSEKVVYVRNPGLVYSHEHHMKLSPAAFVQHAYSNHFITETAMLKDGSSKLIKTPAAKAWLEWEYRAELAGITYDPGAPAITADHKLNSWPGWGVTAAVKGDVGPWKRLLDHLFGQAQAARQWFERWCAFPFQHPGVKMASAAALWGSVHGSGKTMVGHILMNLYGENATEVKDNDLQNPRFEWAENKQFILADDITGDDNRKVTRRFMTMITQKLIRFDIKFVPSFTLPDRINYYFTANEPDLFYLDDDDRRFFIWEVLAGKLPLELRDELLVWRESKAGQEALMYYLLHLSLGDFDPQAPAFQTEAKRAMTMIGKSHLDSWVAQLKETPEVVLGSKLKGELHTAEELYALYDPLGERRASPNAMARALKRAGFKSPAQGSPLRTEQGFRRVYAILNGEQWLKRGHQEAVKHYVEHRAMVKKY